MEVLKEEPEGSALVHSLVSLTGLPEVLVVSELEELFERTGYAPERIKLEQLREALLVYLEEVHASFVDTKG